MEKQGSEKICFVIAPIGGEGTETRRRSDQVLRHIIAPVAEKFDYMTIRADKISDPGIITTQIISHLLTAQLAIADLTERNPNVFYELALRHAFNKPVIHMIDSTEQIPFDVASMRAIKFNYRDMDSVEDCKSELEGQIRAAEQNGATESPVSQTIDLQRLRQSGKPVDKAIADLSIAIEQLSANVQKMQAESQRIRDNQSTGKTLMSRFSGIGSGTYNHGLGVIPDVVIIQPVGAGNATYDNLGSSSVHVVSDSATAWVGLAISLGASKPPASDREAVLDKVAEALLRMTFETEDKVSPREHGSSFTKPEGT